MLSRMYMYIVALTVRPSCWNILTPHCNVLVAVEDKLYVLDQYEAILQVGIPINVHVHVYMEIHVQSTLALRK